MLALALFGLGGPAGAGTGWRLDGTGRYPDANPPVAWSLSSNVVWRTAMPGKSNASPLIVGDRLFVCSEPCTLLCVSLAGGQVLWERDSRYLDLFPPAQREAIAGLAEQANGLHTAISRLRRQQRKAGKALKKSPGDTELKEKIKKLGELIAAESEKLEPVREHMMPATHAVNGHSSATPASDGESVFAVFGNGLVACYDLEGKRRWMRLVKRPTHTYGHSASPLVVGDIVVVHLEGVAAAAADSGEILWRVSGKQRWGTPAYARLGATDAVLTADGKLLRAADGRVILENCGSLKYGSPVVHEGTGYFIEHGGRAVKLPEDAEVSGATKVLWTTEPPKDRYYASALYHEGRLYAITQKHVFSAIDAETGGVLFSRKLLLGGGTVYASVTLGGKYLYVGSDNGTTVVLDPDHECSAVATNRLEAGRGSPVFLGRRMYVRGVKHLYCVGSDAEDEEEVAGRGSSR